MIKITRSISISDDEIKFEFVRASGPGGQNVNKVSTAVQLRFNVNNAADLPSSLKERLYKIARKRISEEGILIIDARRFRSQLKNRQDAIERLTELLRKAAEKPKIRRKTKVTVQSKQKRLDSKRHRGEVKKMRNIKPEDH